MTSRCSLMLTLDSPKMPIFSQTDTPSEEEIKARWQNMDPADMESAEREHFLKTGQVLRTRKIQAKPLVPPPGARLRQVLAMDILDNLDTLSVGDLGTFLSLIGSISNPHALFHRDLKLDAQFRICKRLLSLPDEDFATILVPTCVALTTFDPHLETPSRVLRRKVIPVLRRSLKDDDIATSIDCRNPCLVPIHYRDWNIQTRRALVVSTILSSGRVRPSIRLISNLQAFLGDPKELTKEALQLVEEASRLSGTLIV